MIAAPADADVLAVVQARHGDPFSVLGMHVEDGAVVVRAFLPRAQRVAVVNTQTGAPSAPLQRIDPDGFFAGKVGTGAPFPYRLRVLAGGLETDIEDPYRFGPLLGDLDAYLIAEGTHLRLYDVLGAHPPRDRRRRRRRVRGVGAERERGSASSATSTTGTAARHRDALSPRMRRVGALRARRGRGTALQVRDRRRRDGSAAAAQGRSVRLRERTPAGHRLDRGTGASRCERRAVAGGRRP